MGDSLSIYLPVCIMLFISDGGSFYFAPKWSESGISICSRHLVTLKESPNPKKKPILHHTCATWSELPSYISSMVCLVINLLLFLFVNCLAPIWKVCLCFSSLLFCFTVGILTWYPDKENKSGRFVF